MAEAAGLVSVLAPADLAAARRLLGSIREHNTDGLVVHLLAPEAMRTELAPLLGDDVSLLPLEELDPAAPTLGFAATGILDSYVCMSPRLVFVRAFDASDFVIADGGPLVLVSEERERHVDRDSPAGSCFAQVADLVGLVEPRRLVARGLAVLSGVVVTSLRHDWLEPRGWGFAEAMAACPSEYDWHNAWLMRTHVVPYELREPIVAMLDTQERRLDYELRGVTRTDLARSYVGAVSGPPPELAWLGDARVPASTVLARQLTGAQLRRALLLRVTRKAPRVQGWLGLSRRG